MRIRLFWIFTLLLGFTSTIGQAQGDLEPFEIKWPFRSSTYKGVKLKKIKSKELKQIIYTSEDAEAIKYFTNYQSFKAVGLSLMTLGDIIMAAALIQDIQNANQLNSGNLNIKPAQGLFTGGLVTLTVGTLFLIPSTSNYKKSIYRYNQIVGIGIGQYSHIKTDRVFFAPCISFTLQI